MPLAIVIQATYLCNVMNFLQVHYCMHEAYGYANYYTFTLNFGVYTVAICCALIVWLLEPLITPTVATQY